MNSVFNDAVMIYDGPGIDDHVGADARIRIDYTSGENNRTGTERGSTSQHSRRMNNRHLPKPLREQPVCHLHPCCVVAYGDKAALKLFLVLQQHIPAACDRMVVQGAAPNLLGIVQEKLYAVLAGSLNRIEHHLAMPAGAEHENISHSFSHRIHCRQSGALSDYRPH